MIFHNQELLKTWNAKHTYDSIMLNKENLSLPAFQIVSVIPKYLFFLLSRRNDIDWGLEAPSPLPPPTPA